MGKDKSFYIGSWTAFAAFMASIPHDVRQYVAVIIILVVLDTISGIAKGVSRKELRSSSMREMLFKKTIQYLTFCGLAICLTVLFKTWVFMILVTGFIALAEVSSVLENLVAMQPYGAKSESLTHAVNMIAGVFGIEVHARRQHLLVETTTASVLPADGSGEPVVSVTTNKISQKQ